MKEVLSSRRSIVVAICGLAIIIPQGASAAYPPCKSKPAAPPASITAGLATIHGYGGAAGTVLGLPEVDPLTPPAGSSEADIYGENIVLHMIGYLGGGTTQVLLGGTPGQNLVLTGAQVVTLGRFTGHYKAVARTYSCQSLVHTNTVVRTNYYEFTLSGFITPAAATTPLRGWGEFENLVVTKGDTNPR